MREREAILAFVGNKIFLGSRPILSECNTPMVFYDLSPSITCPGWDELLELNNITESQENLIKFNKAWNTPVKAPLWFLKPYRMFAKYIELSKFLGYTN